MPIDPGTKLGSYEVIEPIGAGGMGEVYRARDDRLRRDVAIKVLPARLAADPEYLARFEREAQAVAQLSHPNILAIHDFGQDGGVTFAVTELLEGETLRSRLDRSNLPWSEAAGLATAIADGLAAAHAKGIVHRDLKPENLFLSSDGRIKILDFGIARWVAPSDQGDETRAATAQATEPGTVLGTVGYMSPEQVRGETVDHRSDVFSLGAILYEMLAGRRPFAGRSHADTASAILNEAPAPLAQDLDVPAGLQGILTRCLKKMPAERYQSARELGLALQSLSDTHRLSLDAGARPTAWRTSRTIAIAVAAAVIVGAFGVWSWQQAHTARQARQELLPEIEELAADIPWSGEGPNAWAAYALASEANRLIPDDPVLQRLWTAISSSVEIRSDPPGARVLAKPYGQPDAAWTSFGLTPLAEPRFPSGFSRIRLELDGYETVDDLFWAFQGAQAYQLQKVGGAPENMVYIEGEEHSLHAVGLDHLPAERLDPFLIDRHEVTNAAYKRFVDGGGYETKTFWTFPFVKDGRELEWADAMTFFKDRTGQAGPSTWEVGDYPDGQDDYPVTGVSWYEAAAFAAFAGKQLPTVYHWDLVANPRASGAIVPLSNYGDGPARVGAHQAISRYGVTDMAGNAREWTLNDSDRAGHRFILGGGWSDEFYSFNDAYTQDAFDRSPINGFRCVQPVGTEMFADAVTRRIDLPFRDYSKETPVSDDAFLLFLRQFEYDKTPLNARIESTDDTASDDWVKETITFDAAYGDERVIAHLYLPKRGEPPYHTVIMFPGDGGFGIRSSARLGPTEYFLKSGRAFLFPVYKSIYERGDNLTSSMPNESNTYREHVVNWSKDIGRSIDYLETRTDIDTGRLAFYGVSWGGRMAPVMLAVEHRFKAAVVAVAGLRHQMAQPEADPFNYLPRVTLPILMLNGRYDFYFPVETSQRPYFEALGTPAADKDWKIYEGSHTVPSTQIAKESLAWLDRYLGPVR